MLAPSRAEMPLPPTEDDSLYFDGSDDNLQDDDELESESAQLLSRPGLYRPLPSAEMARPTRAASEVARPATLGLVGVTVLTYFSTSGGPFGLEVAVAAGGPARTLAALVLFSLISAVPTAMMTAELSSALPGRGGFIHWVDRALSPRVGSLNAWIALLNSAVDASAYPGVCCDYLMYGLRRWGGVGLHGTQDVADGFADGGVWSANQYWGRAAASIVLTIIICAINFAGIRLAARTAILLATFSFAPFVLLFLLCLTRPLTSWNALTGALGETSVSPPADLPLLLAVCLWSTSGFDAVSFVSSEVGHSPKTMPRAMALAILAMAVASVLPIVASCAALGPHGGKSLTSSSPLASLPLLTSPIASLPQAITR